MDRYMVNQALVRPIVAYVKDASTNNLHYYHDVMHAKEMKFQWSRPHLATSFPKESHLKPLFATASPICNQPL